MALPLDISLSDASGAETQPSGEVAVTVDVPRGMDSGGASVYYIADSGDFEKMPGRLTDDGRAYTFQATHFSKYVILGPNDPTASSATLLTSSSNGKILEKDKVYTINGNTTIRSAEGENGLVVGTDTDASHPAVLFIPGGTTLTVRGSVGQTDSAENTGGKAAILLRDGDCLYVRGAGKLNVSGGNGGIVWANVDGRDGWAVGVDMTWEIDGVHGIGGGGGASTSGGGGGGAGIGTDGGAGGAGSGSAAGPNYRNQGFVAPQGAGGMDGRKGGNGTDSVAAGDLSVLDSVELSGSGGLPNSYRAGARGANAFAYEYESEAAWYTSYAGSGGGAGGSGVSGRGALVGSGGGGSGAGGGGGAGGVLNIPFNYIEGYAEGGGGSGGKGVTDGANGVGLRLYSWYTIEKVYGGYGGAGGETGRSSAGGNVTVASTVAFSQTGSTHAIHGKTAELHDVVLDKNSKYSLGFDGNKPEPGLPDPAVPAPVTVTAGVPYTSMLSTSLPYYRFMGFYTEKTGGVQVINDQGYFVKSAGSGAYTTQNGSWCFPEDATLYAHWESRVFAVKLLPGSSFTSAGTSTIYEKYGTGWFSDLSATSPIASITPPTRTGYTFEGYFTAPNGAGTKAIGKDNAVPAGKELFTQDTTLYAHWTSVAYRATVTLRLGASAYTGREVGLYQNGALRYTLKQTGASTGVYEHYQSNAAAADFGVVSGVYDVYVDGVATNEKLTVDGKDVQMTINYYLAEVETTLGGTPAQVGSEATLRSDAFGTVTANWDDGLKKYTAPIHPSGPNNVWKIYVDGADTGYTLDMSQTLRRAAAIPYYNATLGLVYDSGWDDAVVTLRQSGAVKYSLPYTTGDTGPGGTVNTYQKAVPGDTGADLYQVFVNGLDTGETLTLIKNSAATWTAAAEYYAAAVTVTRDGAGQPWADTGVTLWRDGAPAYTLGYDSGAGAYREPYARKYATDSYDVRVAGSISGADTGVKVTEAEPDPAIAYFSVTYTDKENLYLRQTVRDGLKATEPSAPYHYGSTFKGWYTEPMPDDNDEPYDFGSEVKGKLELYAGYDEPEVIIGGYVRCDADGTPNGNGGLYYKMANLVVRGFPATGTPIGSLTLTVRNCEVITYSPPGSESGYNVMKNIDADTGNGTVSIVFTGIGGVGTAEVQRFLRTNVIVKIKDTEAEHRMRVSVFGDTN